MNAAHHRWEQLLAQTLSLLFVAAWLGLFVLILVKLLRPELRQLESAL